MGKPHKGFISLTNYQIIMLISTKFRASIILNSFIKVRADTNQGLELELSIC